MPLVHFHLQDHDISDEQIEQIAQHATAIYAKELESPIDRIRVFINLHAPNLVAVGGKLASKGAPNAPYFEFIVMQGRTVSQRKAISDQFTALLAQTLGVERTNIRGHCITVDPDNWSIGGKLASDLRKAEIASREKLHNVAN